MITCLLFDLDNTLVDAPAGPLRRAGHRARLLDPAALRILRRLSERCGLGIVTSSPLSVATRTLKRTGLYPLFERCICARPSTRRIKPDPAPLIWAMQRLGARPEETVFIGDSMDDQAAARAAGVRFLLAGWAAPTLQTPAPSSCDILQCLGDLSRICFPEVARDFHGEERNCDDDLRT